MIPYSRHIACAGKASCSVDVHRPASVGNRIRKDPCFIYVSLPEDIVAFNSPALSLSCDRTDPFKVIVVSVVRRAVLYVVPDSVNGLQQLVMNLLSVINDSLAVTTQFYPPVAAAHIAVVPHPEVILSEGVCILWPDELYGMIKLPGLEHQRAAHCHAVGCLRGKRLPELIPGLAPQAEDRS